jgi:hypothetical protein
MAALAFIQPLYPERVIAAGIVVYLVVMMVAYGVSVWRE